MFKGSKAANRLTIFLLGSVISGFWLHWVMSEIPGFSVLPPWAVSMVAGALTLFLMVLSVALLARVLRHESELNAVRSERVEALEALVREKTEFTSVLAHEIRTPLNTLIGTLEVARLEDRKLDETEVRRLEQVSAYLIDLVNSTLDYSSLDQTETKSEPLPFNIRALVREVEQAAHGRAQEKQLKIGLKIKAGVPDSLNGDSFRIKQILINLVSNAIKFTPQGGHINLIVSRSQRGSEERVCFRVQDDGPGIDPNDLENIFEPFKQANSGIKRQYGGTGLGLALCQRLAAVLGSEITVYSEVGKGAEFKFCVSNVPATAEQVALNAPKDPRQVLEGLRLMLVEDHPLNAKINARLLETSGAKVVCVSTGEQALVKLQKDAGFDLILMDLNLGTGLSGLEASVVIRNKIYEAKDIPIVALTAGVVRQMHQKVFDSGMLAIVEKPFKLEEVAGVIAQHVAPRQLKAGSTRAKLTAPATH